MSPENRPYQPHPAPVAMSQVARQDELTIGSLCSGYGGLEMGLQAVVGGRVGWHVEYDKHPSAVLAERFPGVPNYGDVTTTDWTAVEPVDWITAGYPCQPFSHAGKRKGSSDERHLWPAVADAVGVLRPRRVLLENVAGHVSLGLDAVLADLAALGYDATWGVVRAADAGAPHGRARLFIVAADSAERGWGRPEGQQRGVGTAERLEAATADADDERRERLGDARRWRHGSTDSGDPAPDADSPEQPRQHTRLDGEVATSGSGGGAWGPYRVAVARWSTTIGRPAPRPTEPGRTGERLSPRFVEWLMGLPAGWVTDVLGRAPALKCLGNGVVPQQAALAVRTLLSLESAVAA